MYFVLLFNYCFSFHQDRLSLNLKVFPMKLFMKYLIFSICIMSTKLFPISISDFKIFSFVLLFLLKSIHLIYPNQTFNVTIHNFFYIISIESVLFIYGIHSCSIWFFFLVRILKSSLDLKQLFSIML